ncbi:hypothetical protein P7F88_05255 [Vibrio hannami]|uniref:hypothetical protein n=1 Tax=Vibrio hannami TaxID=2717094 RepID=UPI002410720D|nr:hypothetical protein [Vibrio hannami]MDG3085540.1 hypothetical protein [Vibrio hannami]
MNGHQKLFYRLADVQPNIKTQEKLNTCVKLNVPVLVRISDNLNVWAIDRNLNKLTKEDVVLSQYDFLKKCAFKNYFFEEPPFDIIFGQPKLSTYNLISSTLVEDVDFLQLTDKDIKKLVLSDGILVDAYKGVVIYDENSETLQLKNTVEVQGYNYELPEKFEQRPANSGILTLRGKANAENAIFVLCDLAVKDERDYKFPVDHIKKNSIQASSCYIRECDVAKIGFNEKEYHVSPFHLEPEYHISSSFLDLSHAGYDLHINKVSSISGGQSGYIQRHYSNLDKGYLANAAARVIKPVEGEELGCNFIKLKKIFADYWLGFKAEHKQAYKSNVQAVLGVIESELKLNSTYAKAVEKIIRPDRFK